MPSTFGIDPALAEIAAALMEQHKDDINAALGARYLSREISHVLSGCI
jgi:hypothetical protein